MVGMSRLATASVSIIYPLSHHRCGGAGGMSGLGSKSLGILRSLDGLTAEDWEAPGIVKGRFLEDAILDYIRKEVLRGTGLEAGTGCVVGVRQKVSRQNKDGKRLAQLDVVVYDPRMVDAVAFREGDVVVVRPEAVRLIASVKANLDWDSANKEAEAFRNAFRGRSGEGPRFVLLAGCVEPKTEEVLARWQKMLQAKDPRIHLLWMRRGSLSGPGIENEEDPLERLRALIVESLHAP